MEYAKMATRRNWQQHENEILCYAYRLLMADPKINKAALCRAVLPELDGRTRGSYEMKLMNLSAHIATLDPSLVVQGYKPYGHAQKDLAQVFNMAWYIPRTHDATDRINARLKGV